MAKAISIFAVLFLLSVVALKASEECRRDYEGKESGFSLCAPLIYPSFCYQRCISENGAKGGVCEDGFKCVCDFCHDPLTCQKKYVGDESDFQLCAPRIFPPFCHRFCISQNGAQGGVCTSDGCYCDFCYNPYPDFVRAQAARAALAER